MTRPLENEVLTVDVARQGYRGEGVALVDGWTLFVEGGLPGERVRVKIRDSGNTFGRGRLIRVEQFSASRCTPVCPLYYDCGGCQIQHMTYPAQLLFKKERVAGELSKVGGFENPPLEECLASPDELAYRNKIEIPVRSSNKGQKIFGFYKSESHNLVPVETCPVHNKLGDRIYGKVRALLEKSPIRAYDEVRHTPGLRHLILRTSQSRQEALLTLVTNGFDCPGIADLGRALKNCDPALKGVVQNSNTAKSNVVLGSEVRLLAGVPFITEEVGGLLFQSGPLSFFQVNTRQANRLAEAVLEFAALSGTESVLDAYCGSGFFSLFAARKARNVLGIEKLEAAVTEARANAERNKISNVRFVAGDAEKLVREAGKPDVAILDPARKGCEPVFLKGLAELGPQRIVYVSCNPATLARDLKILCEKGYSLTRVLPVDMFPQTAHVEAVALLVKGS